MKRSLALSTFALLVACGADVQPPEAPAKPAESDAPLTAPATPPPSAPVATSAVAEPPPPAAAKSDPPAVAPLSDEGAIVMTPAKSGAATSPKGLSDSPSPNMNLGVSDVRSVVQGARPAVRRCYEAALQRNPALSTRVRIRFVVQPSGKVKNVQVEGAPPPEPPLKDLVLRKCLTEVVMKFVFPKFEGSEVAIAFPASPPRPPVAPPLLPPVGAKAGPIPVSPPDGTASPLPPPPPTAPPPAPRIHPAG